MSDFTFANVFKILNDHFQLPNGEDGLQSIKDDREQEQEKIKRLIQTMIMITFHLKLKWQTSTMTK